MEVQRANVTSVPYLSRWNWIAAWDWVIHLLFLPLIVYISPLFLPLLLVFPILLIFRRLTVGRFVPRSPVNMVLVLLLLMGGVSLYATPDILFSLRKVVGLAYGILLFWSLLHFVGTRPDRLRLALALFLLIGWGVWGLSLLAGNLPAKVPLLWPIMEWIYAQYDLLPFAISRVINPNEIGGTLLWFVPLTWALLYGFLTEPLSFGQIKQFLLLGAVTLTAFAFTALLVITQSRSALLGFGITMIVIGWLIGPWPRRTVKAGILIGLGGLIIVMLWAGTGETLTVLMRLTGIGLNPTNTTTDSIFSLSGRIEIWSRAIYGIQDFPFTGMGMNSFRRVVHMLYPLALISPETDLAHAHNHLLQVALDLGLPGLIGYIAIWIVTAIMLIRKWQSGQTSQWHRILMLGLGGGLLAYFIFGITDAIALGARPGFIFWMLLALTLSVCQITPSSD